MLRHRQLIRLFAHKALARLDPQIQLQLTINPVNTLKSAAGFSILQKSGANSLKAVFAGNSKRTISRIIADCQKYIPEKSSRWMALQNVKKHLDVFEPVSLTKFDIANNPS